jgi:hypothetical protein
MQELNFSFGALTQFQVEDGARHLLYIFIWMKMFSSSCQFGFCSLEKSPLANNVLLEKVQHAAAFAPHDLHAPFDVHLVEF